MSYMEKCKHSWREIGSSVGNYYDDVGGVDKYFTILIEICDKLKCDAVRHRKYFKPVKPYIR